MRRTSPISLRRLGGCNAGSVAVEFAVVALPVILLALGTFDYFAANHEITALEAAARSIGEYIRDDSKCGATGFATGTCDPSSLWSTMQTNNSTLSGVTFSLASNVEIYYTCTDNSGTSTTPPTCSVSCGTGCTDTRVVEYAQVTLQRGWWSLFPWDPWSSTNKLTARMSTRL